VTPYFQKHFPENRPFAEEFSLILAKQPQEIRDVAIFHGPKKGL
jgi:hypothetical protein